jgi:secreted trypsin-like serine protease
MLDLNRWTVLPFVVITTLASVTSSNSFAADYIIGGKLVSADSAIAQSTVALVITSPSKETSLCTGSILSPGLIVTAAHCVAGNPVSIRIVFSNRLSPESLRDSIEAANYLAHPSYDPRKLRADQNDIAVVSFSEKLPRGFAPVPLLPETELLKNQETVVLAGFGINDAETREGSGVLRETEVKIRDASLGKTEVVLDQTEGHGACHGDSGGPAFVRVGKKNYLWGVTSRGYPNSASDNCAHEVVYTRIGAHLDFLKEAEQKL